MEDLSLHILDIALNSIEAGATEVSIQIKEDSKKNLLSIIIRDNGRGMDKDTLKRLLDPFFTTKEKKTGLGIPLLAQSAREAGGDISVESTPESGTIVRATFVLDHIDRKPLGDLVSTLMTLIGGSPDVDITFEYRKDKSSYRFTTKDIKKELDGIPLNLPEVWHLIREEIREGLKSLKKGGQENEKEGFSD
jgi:hypothetical protein